MAKRMRITIDVSPVDTEEMRMTPLRVEELLEEVQKRLPGNWTENDMVATNFQMEFTDRTTRPPRLARYRIGWKIEHRDDT